MVKQLEYKDAISLTEEIPTTGHSPLRAICDGVGEKYVEYIIKNNKGQIPSFYLISEILCHYLATCWEINTPEIALVNVDSQLLNNTFSQNHKSHYYNNETFGSKQINNASDVTQFSDVIKSKHHYNKFSNPIDFLKIGMFDIWVDNDDRKPSNFNLLLNSSMEFIAIDHAYTFCTMNYNQLIADISITYNSSIMYTKLSKGIVKYAHKERNLNTYFRDYFYLCLETCEQSYDQITQNIPDSYGFSDELKTSLHDFLFSNNRNNQVLTTFLQWL